MNGEMFLERKNVFEEVNMEDIKESKMGQENQNVRKEEDRVGYSQ